MITAKLYIDISPLEGLRKTLVSKILRKAVTEASKIVKQTVASNASSIKRFGFLAKSIGVKIKTYSEKKSAVAIVGPRSKWFKEIAGRKYRHLLEGGTKRSRQKPFLKPAFDSTKDQYLTTLANAIERGIATQLNAQKTK
jgi:HK97 gp10 family phage protein